MRALTSESPKGCVLVVEDDAGLRFALAAGLRTKGYEVVEAGGCVDALRQLRSTRPDVVLLDLQLADGEAFELLPVFRSTDPSLQVFIITGHGTIGTAVRAVKEGAEDFFTKPLSQSRVHEIVAKAIARRTAVSSGQRPKFAFQPSGSGSPVMRALERQVERLQNADCTVLILGETGTGKSMLARRIHAIGARGKGPCVDVNCAGLTKEFVESELFGHERGSFTGAHAAKSGLFEAANGGTLFLDEIGDIDVQVQPKLLKAIEDKRFRRMGDVRERTADVRLIAATHHDLLAAVANKTFRADLYYRISTVTVTVPALRDRREDILPLAREMLARLGDGTPIELAREAADKLLAYSWPGNIRELKNVLERAMLLRRGHVISSDDFQFEVGAPPTAPTSAPDSTVIDRAPSSSRLLASDASSATREELEREHIRVALEAENGRVEAAARRLGIPRSTLYWKLKHYGLQGGSKLARATDTDKGSGS